MREGKARIDQLLDSMRGLAPTPPDTLCMTDAGAKLLASKIQLVDAALRDDYLGHNRYSGMEIRTFPIGTIIKSKATGERFAIEEGSFFACRSSDLEIAPSPPHPNPRSGA